MLRTPIFAACLLLTSTHAAGRPAGSPPVPDLPPPGGGGFTRPQVLGWSEGRTPIAPPGFTVEVYADGFQSGRWPYVLPNGDVLVSQARTESMGGFPPELVQQLTEQGFFGPSADNILILRQTDAGVSVSVFIDGLNQPFGMLLHRGWVYVANTDSLVRFRYRDGQTRIDEPGEKILDIPAGEEINPWNNHWTRNLIASADGEKLYLSVGSATDANANGNEHPERAAVWELNPDGSEKRLFATGLRNPVGLALHPGTGELWTTVNERDGLGNDVPPDYLTRVLDGEFYGWPYVYYGTYPDPTQARIAPDEVSRARETARVPDLALGGHSVPLGLLFYQHDAFPERYRRGAFVARRAGVGRAELNGPDVLFLPFDDGSPTGQAETFLGGFVDDPALGTVYGRVVGLAVLPDGSLLVTDDGADVIWRVRYTGAAARR